MNFIDKALAEFTNGEDFVQKMADIYEYPEVREELANYPTWIRNMPYLFVKSSVALNLLWQGHDQLDSEKTEYRRSNMDHLPKKIHQNGISYTLVEDYYIPDLKLLEESRPIGRWGRMHKAFLQEYRSPRPVQRTASVGKTLDVSCRSERAGR